MRGKRPAIRRGSGVARRVLAIDGGSAAAMLAFRHPRTEGDLAMPDAYPRDLIGYGARPPHPRWTDDARVALSLVLNYEEGGENCILHGDAASGWRASAIATA